ncbi:19674_t:CDS:2 [Dentiscutata erythropus]|uniref:19674_t:CDS:1 n=1 Tax=Dentiscutata erythropus TaxID=1348616 RepID=A0A9N9EZK0_9GLOM|nr:19674_t:CDS:2 [Dentiscutata erythropus]
MSSTTKNNNSRYRDGCMGPGYIALKNSFIGNLFRKLTFKTSKSVKSQETTNNSSLTNSDPINSIINNKNDDTKIRTPHKVKIKSDHKAKYIPIEIPISNNEQVETNSSLSPQNRPKDIHQLEQKVDALGKQLSQIEQMLNSLVQAPKVDDNVINNLEKNENNDKKDYIIESKNIIKKNLESLTQNLKSHLKSNDQVVGRFNILRTYGMTRDPVSKAYMIVMTLADDGDLSAYLRKHFSELNFIKRLDILYDMATGLCQIHKSGLMHRDLHSGNVMCQRLSGRDPGRADEYRFVIGDLGQATPPIKDEFKRGDELLKAPQQLELHSHNVPYSTFHDTKALTTKSQHHPSYETLSIDIMNNDAFEIPDSEDYSTFEIPDSIDNEDYSTFEIPDSIDNEEISDSLDEVTDSLNNVDLDDIPITPTDESSVLHSVNIEGIKKENASASSYQQKRSTNKDVIVKEKAAYRYSQQSMGSVKFDFSIETDSED